MTTLFSGLFAGGALYFATMWMIARRELAGRSEIEKRRDAIAPANRERITVKDRIRAEAGKYGWNGDLTLLMIGLMF